MDSAPLLKSYLINLGSTADFTQVGVETFEPIDVAGSEPTNAGIVASSKSAIHIFY